MNSTIKDIENMINSTPAEEGIGEFVSGVMKANTAQMISYLFGLVTVGRILYRVFTSGKYKQIDKKSISASIDGVEVDLFPIIKL